MLSLLPRSLHQGKLLLPLRRRLVDLPYYIAEDVYNGPIDDVLLTDLSWDTITNMKEIRELGVFERVKDPSKKLLALTNTLRTVGMLPVESRPSKGPSTKLWVPFIVDTGSRQTYFNKKTAEKLNLESANLVLVDDVKVRYQISGNHFQDLNLLGTDVLGKGVLHIDYQGELVSFKVTSKSAQSNIVWVNLDGGDFFKAFPLQNDVDALKKAVKQERPNRLMNFDAAELTVTNKMDEPSPAWLDIVANKLDPESELVPGQEYSVHTPKE